MNRIATRHATILLMLAATLAAAFSVSAAQAAEPAVRVATLPTVEVVARREVLLAPRVAQLPRVTVVGKRIASDTPTRVAQKPAAAQPRS